MLVHSTYPYEETRVQRQADVLVEHGHDVDVICLRRGTEPSVEFVDGIRVLRIPVRRDKKRGALGQFIEYLVFGFFAFVLMTRMHLRRRYDVVQVHNLPDFLVFAAFVPRLTGSRIILDLHDLMPEFYCAKFQSSMSSLPVRLIALQERLSCAFAHHIITVTESWRQTLIQRGVPPPKCSVVMNLADLRYFQRDASSINSSGKFRLVYHGQVTRRYGLDVLLQALVRVRKEIPNVRLTIHGGGEFMDNVCALVQSLGLEETVALHREFLPVTDLGRFIMAHDVGIVPYRRDVFTDGILPTKLLEYVALELPVIAARTPTIGAYFDENMVEFFESENVEELAQRIVYLFNHAERRQELVHNSSCFNSQFNWTSQREKYARLVEHLNDRQHSQPNEISIK
ncbi:MAG: glycosyltransferase family 4 protein [Chloroflexi bacterium]|nr:glycosyltransferase family 4 protein [Chloroflexota bacterium]